VLVSVGVIENGLLLDRFLGDGEIEFDDVSFRRSGQDGQLQGGESFAGITVGFFGKVSERFFVGLDLERSKSPFLVFESTSKKGNEIT